MIEKIKKILLENEEYIINLRRELHSVPELGFSEFKTSEIIKRELKKENIDFEENVAKTGVRAIIRGGKKGKCVLLRADMDALPIEEKTEVSYKSTHEGVMHACGHDAHVSILLAAAKALNKVKGELSGDVVLVFQPAEETTGGAEIMINEGVMDNPRVDTCFALHVESAYETGTVALKDGAVMASPDEFDIEITGKGGHGAYREKCIDPIYVAATVVKRIIDFGAEAGETEPSVISVGEINGGNFYNIIPDKVTIKGTSRAVSESVRNKLYEGIKKCVNDVCKEYNAEGKLDFRFMYPPLINDKKATDIMRKVAKENGFSVVEIDKPFMGGEDFSYFAKKAPSSYIYIGCRNEEKKCIYPWHNAKFNIDEKCLLNGAVMLCGACVSYLK